MTLQTRESVAQVTSLSLKLQPERDDKAFLKVGSSFKLTKQQFNHSIHRTLHKNTVSRKREHDLMDLAMSKSQEQPLRDSWAQSPIKEFQFPHTDYPEEGHTGYVYSIQLVGNYLISCGQDRSIRIWDVNTQRLVRAIVDAHELSVISVWYDKSTDTIVSGGTDGSLIIWRFNTGEAIRRIENAHEESILNLRSDARYIVSGSKDKLVKLWDRKDYSLKWTAYGHTAAVNSVRLSEDYVVSGSGDYSIRVWNVGNGQLVRIIRGHNRGVASLEVIGDVTGIVSCSSDDTIRVWDGADGRELECLRGHENLVRGLALRIRDSTDPHEDGKQKELGLEMIVSGSYDGSVVVWKKDADGQWNPGLRLHVNKKQPSAGHGAVDDRVYSVQLDDRRIFCSSQAKMIMGWEFSSIP